MVVLRPSPPFLLLLLLSLILQSSLAQSLKCTSEKFSHRKAYANCTDLPTLNSTLHYTFTLENSTLSIAFIAPPATPNGWIAWAINPTKTGMVGSQSLVAFKNSNGTMAVKTYNITSYASLVEGKIAFQVGELSAEFSGGVMKIFATVKLPENMTEVNHVWQVGGSVMNGMPAKHAFLPENDNAKGKLELVGKGESKGNGTAAGGPVAGSPTAGGPTAGVPTVGSPGASPSTSTSSASGKVEVYGILMIFGCLFGFF